VKKVNIESKKANISEAKVNNHKTGGTNSRRFLQLYKTKYER